MADEASREAHLKELAHMLYFRVEKGEDARFSLHREVDVSHPVHHEGLTLDEAERVLNKWKLRGLHGG